MKRIVTALLAAGLAISLLAACGKSQPAAAPDPLDEIRGKNFSDLETGTVLYDTACYLKHTGIMEPVSGAFVPYEAVTRQFAAETVYNLCGAPETTGKTRFSDAADIPAVAWCDENGLLADITGTSFAGDTLLTRQELAGMLMRLAAHRGMEIKSSGDLGLYADGAEVTAVKAVCWAMENKVLTTVIASDRILPTYYVSRLQLGQGIIGLLALEGKDPLAKAVHDQIPTRDYSDARGNHEAIQRVINTIGEKYNAQGLQVAVVENGAVTDTFAYGWATRNTDPMTADHKLRIASISKVGVGVAAMLMAEDGIIDLDADISPYWDTDVKHPQHPNDPITVRNMMTHTSGIFSAGDNTSRAYEKVRKTLQGSGYSSAIPGDITGWEYNNYAYSVLGMTLEIAAKKTLNTYLNERLFRHMDIDAAYGPGDIRGTDMLATIYSYGTTVSRSVEELKTVHSHTTPGEDGKHFAGGLTTSARDLGKLLALLAGDGVYEGVRLMAAESVAEMETRIETPTPDGSQQAHPMRYWENLYGRKGIYFHTGSAYGVFNCFCYDPYTGDGVVVLTTGSGGAKDNHSIYKICAAVNNHIYRVIE